MVLVLIASSTACRKRSGSVPNVDVVSALEPSPPIAGPATLTVTLRDAEGGPVKGAAVRLEAQMSHPGMAPVLANGTERAPGVYDLRFTFTMPGDWVLLVTAVLPGGERVDRRIDVPHVKLPA